MNELLLMLSDPPGDEDGLGRVGREIDALGEFAFSHGEERSPDVNEYLWFGSREGDEISVLDDFALGARYVAIRSSRVEKARSIRDGLAPHLSVVAHERLLADARGDDPAALVRLVMAGDEMAEDVADLVAERLQHADQAMRRHAVMAASMSSSS